MHLRSEPCLAHPLTVCLPQRSTEPSSAPPVLNAQPCHHHHLLSTQPCRLLIQYLPLEVLRRPTTVVTATQLILVHAQVYLPAVAATRPNYLATSAGGGSKTHILKHILSGPC